MEPFDIRAWKGWGNAGGATLDPVIIDQVTIDSRRIHSKRALFVALGGANFDGHDFLRQAYRQGARYAIVRADYTNDALPDDLLLLRVADPLRALQAVASAYRCTMPAKVVAITGSYGKTMLKDLLTSVLDGTMPIIASPESFNSQIGVALSLLTMRASHTIAFIEAGISEPGEMDHLANMIQPDHAVITAIKNPGSDEQERLIAQEKMKLVERAPRDNWSLLPSHPLFRQMRPMSATWRFWDDLDPALPQVIKRPSSLPDALEYELIFPDQQRFIGRLEKGLGYAFDLVHMGVRILYLLGIAPEVIFRGLTSYLPEPMRIEVWKTHGSTTCINDTYCQDPMSCDVALRQFESLEEHSAKPSGKKIFLFGGLRGYEDQKESDYGRIAHAIAKNKVDLLVVAETQCASTLVSHLSLIAPHTEVMVCRDLAHAMETTRKAMGPGDTVLIKGARKVPVADLIRAFDGSPPNNQVIINLAAIQANIEAIRAHLGKKMRLMVMVKALAYGTDDVRISKFLKSCKIDILGVSYVDEAVALREQGVSQNIFVLNATPYEAAKAVKWNVEVGVSEMRLVQALEQEAAHAGKRVRVHLHVDTGMSRFGCRPRDVLALAEQISSAKNLVLDGVMTHFACAEDSRQDDFTREQARTFESAIDLLEGAGFSPRWRHAQNSAAAMRFSFPCCNMVRIGLAAYGLHASCEAKTTFELKPTISLVSHIVGMNEVHQGETVSYGRLFTAESTSRIAVLPIGYYDGLHGNYSDKGFVMIRGQKAPMVGRICMDYLMVDVTNIPAASIGDQALLFGEDEHGFYVAPEELAQLGGSIVHELMTCLGPRIRRLFIYDESLRPR